MREEEKKPHTPGVKGLMFGSTNVHKIYNIRNSKELITNSLIGKSIINLAKDKSPFKSHPFKQFIEEARKEPLPRKLIGSLIYENELIILFAATGLGKSIKCIQIAISASKGESLDLGDGVILRNEAGPVNTIFFDFELSGSQLAARMGRIDIPENLTIAKIERGQVLSEKPLEVFNLIKAEAELSKSKFIIIDNMSKIGYDLEKSENAIKFMSALSTLVRFDGYTVLIIAHTPKLNKAFPITSDSLGGSSKLSQLADALIGINEVNTEEGGKVYIKQIKTRNGKHEFGSGNVICTEIIQDSTGFVRHQCYATCSEAQALKGTITNSKGYRNKMHATASYFYYGSYDKASKGTGIPMTTLKQRVKYLKRDSLDDYNRLEGMSKNDLKDQINIYFDEKDLINHAVKQ